MSNKLPTLSLAIDQVERIRDMLNQLKLSGMEASFIAFCQKALEKHATYHDLIEWLLEHEIETKNKDSIQRRITYAHFPFQRTVEDFVFSRQPSVDPKQIHEFASTRFIANTENII